jgi:hypothetical protein
MSLIDDIRNDVQEISKDRGLTEDRAFGYWFLERYEDLSPEEAEDTITDGPWDRGRDAVYLDEENDTLKIYQFKYSENLEYVRNTLTDVQTGLRAEEWRLPSIDIVNLIIVTIASGDAALYDSKVRVERRKKDGLSVEDIRQKRS